MSYILEALKKAQAERQLGATPTIHAPTLGAGAARVEPGAQWKPYALAAGAALAAGVLVMLWRQPAADSAPAPQAAAPAGPAAQSVPPAAGAAATAHHAAPGSAGAVPAQPAAAMAAPALPPSPVAVQPPAQPPSAIAVPPPAAAPSASPAHGRAAPAAGTQPAPAQQLAAALPAQAAPGAPELRDAAPKVAPAPAAAKPVLAAAEPQEEPVQALRDLPEPIQRSIPPIAMGGYMYSRNAADRLLLIDKVLRREGEEVAPGLVLEKLQPKAAVFTFKGYRYRVPL